MLSTTITDFRKNLKSYLDSVTNDFETLIINRNDNSGVVVLSLEEYNSMSATKHELSSKKNRDRLDSSIAKIEAGLGEEKMLIEE
jgi:antitoxin YefM